MECQILISATPVSQPQTVQVIISSKYFATALHNAKASASGIVDKEVFLENIVADALATQTDEVSLTMIDKVGTSLVVVLLFVCVADQFVPSGLQLVEYACWKLRGFPSTGLQSLCHDHTSLCFAK
jgi:hypothetical protein